LSIVLAAVAALAACRRAREPRLFELLPPERTGVTFANRLPDDTAALLGRMTVSTAA
jgi:hypothetical protein